MCRAWTQETLLGLRRGIPPFGHTASLQPIKFKWNHGCMSNRDSTNNCVHATQSTSHVSDVICSTAPLTSQLVWSHLRDALQPHSKQTPVELPGCDDITLTKSVRRLYFSQRCGGQIWHGHPTSTQLRWLWDELDRRVEAEQPTSARHLWELLQDGWRTIPGDYLMNLIERMPRASEAVIEAKGGCFIKRTLVCWTILSTGLHTGLIKGLSYLMLLDCGFLCDGLGVWIICDNQQDVTLRAFSSILPPTSPPSVANTSLEMQSANVS